MSIHVRRGVAAVGAATLTLGLGVLSAPMANANGNEPVPTDPQGLSSFIADASAKTDGAVVGAGLDADKNVVLFLDDGKIREDAEAEAAVDSLLDRENVTEPIVTGSLEAYADTDVVGGSGYAIPTDEGVGSCSVGFAGWTPSGDQTMISAGHCTGDGANNLGGATVPSSEPAGGSDAGVELIRPAAPDFALDQSQFGGPGNAPGAECVEVAPGEIECNIDPDAIANLPSYVDISTWNVAEGLDLRPEVTNWQNTDDLSQSTVPVTGVGRAQVGGEISKSGRTTGYTTDTVVASEGFAVIDGRVVSGFAIQGGTGADAFAAPGDSGGSMIQGGTAVGLISGGNPNTGFVWGADLQNALGELEGNYTVALDLAEPALTAPEDGGTVGRGGAITGTGPANAELTISSEGREDQTVDINGEGNWTFNAVEELGTYEFSLTATLGFDSSDTVDFSVEVAATGPAITAPENGSTVVGSVNAISGTGDAGAEVTVAGDAEGTATVDAEGNWSVPVNLGPGEYRVSATQVVDGDESAVTSSSFTVIPDAPVITTPEDGVSYRAATAPKGAEGTGIDGATLTVFLNDEEIGETTVENGEWSVAFEDGLKAGDYTLRAVQTVNEQSNDAGVSFALLEDAAAPGPGDDLPRTGIAAMLPYILGGAALLAAGGAAMEIRRRRGLGDIA